jgi:hypothetical protein
VADWLALAAIAGSASLGCPVLHLSCSADYFQH